MRSPGQTTGARANHSATNRHQNNSYVRGELGCERHFYWFAKDLSPYKRRFHFFFTSPSQRTQIGGPALIARCLSAPRLYARYLSYVMACSDAHGSLVRTVPFASLSSTPFPCSSSFTVVKCGTSSTQDSSVNPKGVFTSLADAAARKPRAESFILRVCKGPKILVAKTR